MGDAGEGRQRCCLYNVPTKQITQNEVKGEMFLWHCLHLCGARWEPVCVSTALCACFM